MTSHKEVRKLPIIKKRESSSGEDPDAVAQAVGRVSIKVSDCLPYLKCFNVEDIVNIRGHFSSQKYLRDTEATKEQLMKEKATATTAKINKRQMDVAKTG